MEESTENPTDPVDNGNHVETGSSSSRSTVEIDKYGFTGGSQYTNPEFEEISVIKIRQREVKWLTMLDNWDLWMAKKFQKVKRRCRKGIPSSLRGRAWQLLSGSNLLQKQQVGKYMEFLQSQAGTNTVEDIEKDLHRQFPFHEMFAQRGGTGQQDLYNILYAYAVYNPKDGYCQAHAPIAAVLLMHMPAEEAFWCMVAMFDFYIPGYFSPGLEVVQVDGSVMQGLLRAVCPIIHKHMEKHNVSPMLYCTEWFMCIFSRTLPWPSVLRLWDMFFCEGVKTVFRCGLVLLRSTLGTSEVLKQLPGLYETMEKLRKIDQKVMQPEVLMHEIIELKVSESDLENEHRRQQKQWKSQQPASPVRLVKRIYRYTPTHQFNHSNKKSEKGSKQKLNAISINTPQIMEQTRSLGKKNRRLSKESLKRDRPAVQLKTYKRNLDDSTSLSYHTDSIASYAVENASTSNGSISESQLGSLKSNKQSEIAQISDRNKNSSVISSGNGKASSL